MTACFYVPTTLLRAGNSLISGLCRRTDTLFKDEENGHRRMRFIRTMKRNTGNREKMWAGQTAPFFARKKAKRPVRAFSSSARQISVRGL
ncbi:hypothetical protein C0J26_08115 [Pseudomonas baetica]|nr:hypothetical protein C0J26_08115 [Pseudomonas baetica]